MVFAFQIGWISSLCTLGDLESTVHDEAYAWIVLNKWGPVACRTKTKRNSQGAVNLDEIIYIGRRCFSVFARKLGYFLI
jgi:hypothetical protein